MNKSILTLIAGAALVAGTIIAEEPNGGMAFYDDGKPEKKEAGEGEASPMNIDGISFGIAEKKNPKEIDWAKRAKHGSRGNVTCYVDNDGVPTAVFVVGIGALPKTMDDVDAEEEAQLEAEANAKEAFAIWVAERLSVRHIRNKRTLVVKTGTDGENHSRSDESEAVTKRERVFEQSASVFTRGMSLFGSMLKDGRYIAVWRWSVQEQQLAKMVEMLSNDEDPRSVKGGKDRKTYNVEEREFSFRNDD